MPAVCPVQPNAIDGLAIVHAQPTQRSFFETSEPEQATGSRTKAADGPNCVCVARQMPVFALRETRSESSGQNVRLFVIELGRAAVRMDAMSHDATAHGVMTLGVMMQLLAIGELNHEMIWPTIVATEHGGWFERSIGQRIAVWRRCVARTETASCRRRGQRVRR